MKHVRRWCEAILAGIGRSPLGRRLFERSHREVLLWTCLSTLVFVLVGGVLGGLNRGGWGGLVGALCGLSFGIIVGILVNVFYVSGKARATLTIELDKAEGWYLPGDSVKGHIQVQSENTFKANGAKIFLVCRGLYVHDRVSGDGSSEPEFVRETREYALQQANVIPPGTLHRGVSRYPFSLGLPHVLATHHGYACSIRWMLHAVLAVPREGDVGARRELLVQSITPALQPAPTGYRSTVATDVCQLILTLARAVCAEGETVEAQVRIAPQESFRAQEVRALLLRIENTPSGDNHIVYISAWNPDSGHFQGERRPGGQGTTYVWLEDETHLAGPMRFEAADSMAYTFAFGIPKHWRPTLSTDQGRVTWKVGVVVSRESQDDVRVFHEVIVHTGGPAITRLLQPDQPPSPNDAD